ASSPANISPVGPPPATTTAWSAIRHPHFRRFWFQPETMLHDPGLAASPPVRCMLRVARRECSPSLDGPRWAIPAAAALVASANLAIGSRSLTPTVAPADAS